MSPLLIVLGLTITRDVVTSYSTTMTYRHRKCPISDSTYRSSSDAFARDNSPRVTTSQAMQPRRLAPFPSLFLVNYLSKVSLDLFPPPSDELRQDRTIIMVEFSDATSGPPPIVSSHFWPFYDDCSAIYPDVDRPGLGFTIVECFPRLLGVDVAYQCACLHLD